MNPISMMNLQLQQDVQEFHDSGIQPTDENIEAFYVSMQESGSALYTLNEFFDAVLAAD